MLCCVWRSGESVLTYNSYFCSRNVLLKTVKFHKMTELIDMSCCFKRITTTLPWHHFGPLFGFPLFVMLITTPHVEKRRCIGTYLWMKMYFLYKNLTNKFYLLFSIQFLSRLFFKLLISL